MWAPIDDDWLYINGYNTDRKQETFRTPRAKYRVIVVANAMNAEPDRMEFTVSPTRSGSLSCKASSS